MQPVRMCADVLKNSAVDAAPQLLGAILEYQGQRVRLIEVEAYQGQDDPACHAARGRTARNAPMFGPPGMLYVYLIYGCHWMLNLVCDEPDTPAAVLVRAAVALESEHPLSGRLDGPGRLCRSLGIDGTWSAQHLGEPGAPRLLWDDYRPQRIACDSRIGIRTGLELLWRFCDLDFESHLSRRPGDCAHLLAK